jgi:hypothetical protein
MPEETDDTEYRRGMFYPQPIQHLDMYRYQQLQSVTQVVIIDEVTGMQLVIFEPKNNQQ